MNIKRNIIFTLEKRKNDGVTIVENVPIRMRVIYNGKRVEFTTGYRIDAAKWDPAKQRVKFGCTNKLKQRASEINADLLRYYTEIQNTFKEFEVRNTLPTTVQLKEAFSRLHDEVSGEEEIPKHLLFSPLAATYEKFAAVKAHLSKFDPEMSFESLDESRLRQYVQIPRRTGGIAQYVDLKTDRLLEMVFTLVQ